MSHKGESAHDSRKVSLCTWFHSVTAASAVEDPVLTTSPNLSAPSCFLLAPRHACRVETGHLKKPPHQTGSREPGVDKKKLVHL